jgi:hypothetical protein
VASSLTRILGGPRVEGKRSRLKCELAELPRISEKKPRRWPGVTLACEAYTSLTFFNGSWRTGLPVAA